VEPAGAAPVKVGVVSLVIPSDLEDPVSLARSRSGVEGPMVHWYVTLWLLPAWSKAVRTKLWGPMPRPLSLVGLVAVVGVPPSRLYLTARLPAAVRSSVAVKVKVAEVLVDWESGMSVRVTVGPALSTTMVRVPEGRLVSPEASLAVAEIECGPLVSPGPGTV